MELEYNPGTRNPSEIREFVLQLLQEIQADGEALEMARAADINVETLRTDPPSPEEISIKASKSGIDPFTGTVIIVTIARPFVLDLWRKVLLPRIERRWGPSAIGPEVKPRHARNE
jgi:hypothetical protein